MLVCFHKISHAPSFKAPLTGYDNPFMLFSSLTAKLVISKWGRTRVEVMPGALRGVCAAVGALVPRHSLLHPRAIPGFNPAGVRAVQAPEQERMQRQAGGD